MECSLGIARFCLLNAVKLQAVRTKFAKMEAEGVARLSGSALVLVKQADSS
jgi:hypothetical protein